MTIYSAPALFSKLTLFSSNEVAIPLFATVMPKDDAVAYPPQISISFPTLDSHVFMQDSVNTPVAQAPVTLPDSLSLLPHVGENPASDLPVIHRTTPDEIPSDALV